ncbi:spinster family MFS transporter [Parasphingorhabdus sp.]|uniref:spinster family MFS transporter n=1 Tax=Parasphingorhabdus sp. TaxID=2709688 RepID=UPI003A93CDD0
MNRTAKENYNTTMIGGWRRLVILLFFINVLNYVDRQIPFILIEQIKQDLLLSDAEIGIVSGLTFTIVYSIASVPLANLSDRWSPRGVLMISIVTWCGLTALSGLTRSLWQFGATRIGVAAGEAGCTPTSHSLISSFVPPSRRAMAIAVFSLGVPIGGMLGLIAGGWLGDAFGWRMTMVIIGLPGLLLAFGVFAIVPRSRNDQDRERSRLTFAMFGEIFRLRTMGWIVGGVSMQGVALYAVYSFAAAFLMRSYGISMSEAGLGLGIANGVSGIFGLIVGGWLASVNNQRALFWAAIGFLASAPLIWLACATTEYMLALVLLSMFNFTATLHMPTTFGTVQALAPAGRKAMATSLIIAGIGLIGGSLGPVGAGLLSDLFAPVYGENALKVALSFSCVPVLVAGFMILKASKLVDADMVRAA